MEIDGLNVGKVEGEGTPIIFVHGWLGSAESWEQVREELSVENPSIFYDQRCHGESSCRNFLMEDLAADLEKVVETLDESPIIVGHSMGGMAALQYTSGKGSHSGLVLLGTCASTPRPKYRSPKFFLERLSEMARQRWAEMIADNYAERSPEMREGAVQELKDAGRKPVVNGLKAMIKYDVRDELEKEDAVVVAGEKDTTITVEQSSELAELLDCRLEIIDSSHLMLQETPETVAEIIKDFTEKSQ